MLILYGVKTLTQFYPQISLSLSPLVSRLSLGTLAGRACEGQRPGLIRSYFFSQIQSKLTVYKRIWVVYRQPLRLVFLL